MKIRIFHSLLIALPSFFIPYLLYFLVLHLCLVHPLPNFTLCFSSKKFVPLLYFFGIFIVHQPSFPSSLLVHTIGCFHFYSDPPSSTCPNFIGYFVTGIRGRGGVKKLRQRTPVERDNKFFPAATCG